MSSQAWRNYRKLCHNAGSLAHKYNKHFRGPSAPPMTILKVTIGACSVSITQTTTAWRKEKTCRHMAQHRDLGLAANPHGLDSSAVPFLPPIPGSPNHHANHWLFQCNSAQFKNRHATPAASREYKLRSISLFFFQFLNY